MFSSGGHLAAESTEESESESECGERGGGVRVRRKARSGFIGFVLFSLVVGMGRGGGVGMGGGVLMDLLSFVGGGGGGEGGGGGMGRAHV